MKYLAFDCETGGLDCNKHSLLTAYFSVYDEDFNLIDELDLYLKPSDEKLLNVTQEALKVTQINITDHLSSPNTITYEEGNKLLLKLLEKHKTKGKKRHYRPIGQNLQFDLNFIFAQLISEEDWSKTVHHNNLDRLINRVLFVLSLILL
jgi:oligoribonuclease (3'-5' exoribonuclease)